MCPARVLNEEGQAGRGWREGGFVLKLRGSVGGGEEAHHSRSHKWPRKSYIPPFAAPDGLYWECNHNCGQLQEVLQKFRGLLVVGCKTVTDVSKKSMTVEYVP